MRRRKKEKRTPRRLMKELEELGLTRGVLTVFFFFFAVFGIAITLADFLPNSILNPVVTVLGVPPALLIIAVGALTSTLSQTLIDVFFLPAAFSYWLLLALAINRVYRIVYRQLGKLLIQRLHA